MTARRSSRLAGSAPGREGPGRRVARRGPGRRWHRVALGGALAAFLAAGWPATAVAAPHITATTPATIFVNTAPEVRLHGSGFVPAGSPVATLSQVQKVFVRGGSQGSFVPAPLVIPSGHGWGATAFSAKLPSGLKLAPGVLQVQVTVNGVASNVFEIPVVPLPSPAVPHITAVSPAETAMGATAYYFILRVSGTGIDAFTKPRFQGLENIPVVGGDGFVQFSVPESFRNKPGRYTIQLVNAQGVSNLAHWDLVVKPQIAKLTPASISPAKLAERGASLGVTIAFTGSPPKKVWARADTAGWAAVAPRKLETHTVEILLDLAALGPKKQIDLKLANAAGESNIATMHVLMPIEQKALDRSPAQKPGMRRQHP